MENCIGQILASALLALSLHSPLSCMSHCFTTSASGIDQRTGEKWARRPLNHMQNVANSQGAKSPRFDRRTKMSLTELHPIIVNTTFGNGDDDDDDDGSKDGWMRNSTIDQPPGHPRFLLHLHHVPLLGWLGMRLQRGRKQPSGADLHPACSLLHRIARRLTRNSLEANVDGMKMDEDRERKRERRD